MCLWIQVHPLVDSMVEEVNSVDSDKACKFKSLFYIVLALRLRQNFSIFGFRFLLWI